MTLSIVACIGVAIYCFANGLIVTGIITLFGLIPGPGILPLLVAAVLLFVNGFHLAALFPLLVIANNVRVAFQSVGPGEE